MKYIVNTALTDDSDACNALDGIAAPSNLDTGYVQATNRYYRFFSASVLTANGTSVVIPVGQDPGDPGRWIRQGAPGPCAIIPNKPSNLGSCNNSGGGETNIGAEFRLWKTEGGEYNGSSIIFSGPIPLPDGTYAIQFSGGSLGGGEQADAVYGGGACSLESGVVADNSTCGWHLQDISSTVLNDLLISTGGVFEAGDLSGIIEGINIRMQFYAYV